MKETFFLHPELKQKLDVLISRCKELDLGFKITCTLRTEFEQGLLYGKGRSSNGKTVTLGQYPNNYHCWGLAFDIIADIDIEPTYDEIAIIAKSLGLVWGGDNHELRNIRHFEYQKFTLKELRITYENYKNFRVLTWDSNYKPFFLINDYAIDYINIYHKSIVAAIQNACRTDGFRTSSNKMVLVTGVLDDDTLDALDNVKMYDFQRYALIKIVQNLLVKAKFNVAVTGKFDADTRNSIVEFARKENLPPCNTITKDFMVSLLTRV